MLKKKDQLFLRVLFFPRYLIVDLLIMLYFNSIWFSSIFQLKTVEYRCVIVVCLNLNSEKLEIFLCCKTVVSQLITKENGISSEILLLIRKQSRLAKTMDYGAILNTLLNNKRHCFIIRETLTTFITLIDCVKSNYSF